MAEGDVDFGVFEIPTQVFDDPLRPFPITAHLVLECLMKSVAAHRTIAILSEVLTHLVDGVPYMMKHFYLVALPERIIIRDVAARWVKQCVHCAEIVASPGPEGCITCLFLTYIADV